VKWENGAPSMYGNSVAAPATVGECGCANMPLGLSWEGGSSKLASPETGLIDKVCATWGGVFLAWNHCDHPSFSPFLLSGNCFYSDRFVG